MTDRGFCDVAALSRYTNSGRWVKIGKWDLIDFKGEATIETSDVKDRIKFFYTTTLTACTGIVFIGRPGMSNFLGTSFFI